MSQDPKSPDLKRRLSLLRTCGSCRACCTTQIVDVLKKPADVPCVHLNPNPSGPGCLIYTERPDSCAKWACVWRSGSNVLVDEERPDLLGVVLDTVETPKLPWSFLCAVSIDPLAPEDAFQRALPTILRLSQTRVVVCEHPSGWQDIFGPPEMVAAYTEVFQK